MRKIIFLALILGLSLIILAGCGSSQKSAEELKAEIKAELKAEMEAQKNTTTDAKNPAGDTSNFGVRDGILAYTPLNGDETVKLDFNDRIKAVGYNKEGANYEDLSKGWLKNPAYQEHTIEYSVAFFGEGWMKLITHSSMSADPVITDFNYLKDHMIYIKSSFPHDGSSDIIELIDSAGKKHQIVVEDLQGNMRLILVEKE
ncbi:MAG: hypothetical protein ACOYVD_12710 [Bacillota bacterium]